jgi:hypothetical protein
MPNLIGLIFHCMAKFRIRLLAGRDFVARVIDSAHDLQPEGDDADSGCD